MSHGRRNSIGNGMKRMGRKGRVEGLDNCEETIGKIKARRFGVGRYRGIKSETLRGLRFRIVSTVRHGTRFEGETLTCPGPLRVGLRRAENSVGNRNLEAPYTKSKARRFGDFAPARQPTACGSASRIIC